MKSIPATARSGGTADCAAATSRCAAAIQHSAASQVDSTIWPKRVALVATQRGLRGGETQLALLAEGLRERGVEVTLLARKRSLIAERLGERGFAVHQFPGRGRTPWALAGLRRMVRTWRPDVLWMNDSHALTAAGLASWGLPIGLRVASRRVAFAIRGGWQYRHLADAVVANSRAVADRCRAAGVPNERLRVVYDGVEPPRADREFGARQDVRDALGITSDAALLLVVAALTSEKGHAVLLDALAAVRGASPSFRLLVVGDGPLRATLAAQTARLGLSDRVQFLGQRDDVPRLLAAADLFVMPSLVEGLCTAALEAQLAGVPLVTTTAGGLAEVANVASPCHGGPADNALTGSPNAEPVAFTAAPGDAASLAAAILAALGDREQRLRLAQLAQARAARLFTVERMVDETLATLRELRSLKPSPLTSLRQAGP